MNEWINELPTCVEIWIGKLYTEKAPQRSHNPHTYNTLPWIVLLLQYLFSLSCLFLIHQESEMNMDEQEEEEEANGDTQREENTQFALVDLG